ncbi:MAG: cation:proton antiporter [Gemmatimonadota bacterium]|jgi:Kef-type K+ transport system membrane component KefB
MARFFTLVVFVGVTYALRFLFPPGETSGSATLFLGFLLLASFLAGRAAKTISLPQITGYLVIGILVGPSALKILTSETVEEFRFVNDVALALIALSAGGELRIGTLLERMKSIAAITLSQIVLMFALVASAVFLARGSIHFLADQPTDVAVAVALLFGLVAVAKSPATTIAIITEERARGILTNTVLGITVLKDVIILILIAILIPLADALVDPTGGFSFSEAREILLEILGSLSLGVALGWLVTVYLNRIRAYRILFVLGVAFLAVYLGDVLGLEDILIAMAAGFYVQNYSRQGRRLLHALEANSLPLYALFFAVAGADLKIGVLESVWEIATAIILARLLAAWISTWLGAKIVGDPPEVGRFAWLGFLAQAGVTLGIANRVRDSFPLWGTSVSTIIVATIVINQLIGPPAFRWALVRAGESNQQERRRRRLS